MRKYGEDSVSSVTTLRETMRRKRRYQNEDLTEKNAQLLKEPVWYLRKEKIDYAKTTTMNPVTKQELLQITAGAWQSKNEQVMLVS